MDVTRFAVTSNQRYVRNRYEATHHESHELNERAHAKALRRTRTKTHFLCALAPWRDLCLSLGMTIEKLILRGPRPTGGEGDEAADQ